MVAQRSIRSFYVVPALLLALLLSTGAPPSARAARSDESIPDAAAAALADLQQRAEHAQVRDRCFLYSQLVHELTELAGRQMAAGDEEKAAATVARIDAIATEIEKSSAADAKRLKNAEQLLQQTTRRLGDMARVAADEERSRMQTTLRHLDAVHSSVLALVFAQ